jgi:hypothetical protein
MDIAPGKPLLFVRVALVATITLLLSGWNTCTVMGALDAMNVCQTSTPQPQLISLSPDSIPVATESTVLKLNGSNFTAQSQMAWNGNSLPTTFVNSSLLETTITQQTIARFAPTPGSTVQISVTSSSAVEGCLSGVSTAELVLVIN